MGLKFSSRARATIRKAMSQNRTLTQNQLNRQAFMSRHLKSSDIQNLEFNQPTKFAGAQLAWSESGLASPSSGSPRSKPSSHCAKITDMQQCANDDDCVGYRKIGGNPTLCRAKPGRAVAAGGLASPRSRGRTVRGQVSPASQARTIRGRAASQERKSIGAAPASPRLSARPVSTFARARGGAGAGRQTQQARQFDDRDQRIDELMNRVDQLTRLQQTMGRG